MSEFFDKTIDRSNTPNGKTSQTFYFKTHYEAKHAIGKQHIKRIEFENRPGIASIDSLCEKFYHTSESPLHYGRFIISGKSSAVDKLMIEIKEWLDTCQKMHYHNINNKY